MVKQYSIPDSRGFRRFSRLGTRQLDFLCFELPMTAAGEKQTDSAGGAAKEQTPLLLLIIEAKLETEEDCNTQQMFSSENGRNR